MPTEPLTLIQASQGRGGRRGTRTRPTLTPATFLECTAAVYALSFDQEWKRKALNAVPSVVSAMLLTLQHSGRAANLTAARPDSPACYTMDNVEVVRGLRAVAGFTAWHPWPGFSPASQAAKTQQAVDRVLWLDATAALSASHYALAIFPDTEIVADVDPTDWGSSVLVQLMAIAWLPIDQRSVACFGP